MRNKSPGIHVDSLTNVQVNRSSAERKLSELKPGDKVCQVDSSWYVGVDEVRISKRRQVAYRIELETGEELLLTEGTILCGQYGPNLVTDAPDKVLCLANLGRFFDSNDSRRQFEVQFAAPDHLKQLITSLCRPPKSAIYQTKKFYRWSQMFEFLRNITVKHPDIQVLSGLSVQPDSEEGIYDFVHAAREAGHNGAVFMPTFELQEYVAEGSKKPFVPTILAVDGGYHIVSRKVIGCQRVIADGPWAYPVFDSYESGYEHYPHRRYSFYANGVCIFYPNPFISDYGIRATLPREGQELHLPAARGEDAEEFDGDFSDIYQTLQEQGSDSEISPEEINRLIDAALEALGKLAAADVDEERLLTEFDKRLSQREA
jgi:hypothetical protein